MAFLILEITGNEMRAFIEVHLKLVMTIWIILASVLGLLYLMNYMKFNNLISGVVSSQLQVMSSSLERSIIKAEQLGLPLKEMDNLPELLQRSKSRDPQVNSIFVINQSGEVLFSTDQRWLNHDDKDAVLRKALKGNEISWTLEKDLTLYSGQQLFDSTQQLIGSIVIAYNKASYGSTVAQVKLHLLEMTVMIFVVFALLIFIAVRFGFSEVNSVFKLINQQLSAKDNQKIPASLKPGSMAHEFARQISRSNEMKHQVESELDKISVSPNSSEGKNS